MPDETAFVCAFTEDDSGGIYTFGLDQDGSLEQLHRQPVSATSFLAISADGEHLYSVNRVDGGQVEAFDVDEDGSLSPLNAVSSGGEGPAYVSVDDAGEYAFVANYAGGSVEIVPIADDGSLEEPTHVVEHEGSSVDESRQQEPHPHSIVVGPNDDFVYVPDLGSDTIEIYRIDRSNDRLEPADPANVELHPGAGPRHFDFHANGELGFVINELDSTITAYEYDAASGALSPIETYDTLPAGYDEESYCADIHIHPNGELLYGSNRGHNSIVVFDLDPSTGALELVDHESTRGDWPRNFAISPDGSYLFVENRRTDSIVTFAIADDGTLEVIDEDLELPEPICMEFRP